MSDYVLPFKHQVIYRCVCKGCEQEIKRGEWVYRIATAQFMHAVCWEVLQP